MWGVDYRYETTIADRVGEGDRLCFYVLQNMRSGLRKHVHAAQLTDVDRRELELARGSFVGIWEVSGPYFQDNTPIGWVNRDGQAEVYPHRRAISLMAEPAEPIPLKPDSDIFSDLLFITDKTSSWYNILYASMALISDDDMTVFEAYAKYRPREVRQV